MVPVHNRVLQHWPPQSAGQATLSYLGRTVDRPPSIPSTCPVTQLCSGLNSHSKAAATSAGSPMRPRACMAVEALREASFSVNRAVIGVRTSPGATQFTRMPRGAYVAAAERVRPITPALAAAIASWLARPTRAAHDETRTIEPPVVIIAFAAAFRTANAVVKLVATVDNHSDSLVV